MKILIDMNLSPRWTAALRSAGIEATHWSEVGGATASYEAILDWAGRNGHIVLTHDLDFSAILAASGGNTPSVIQLRSETLQPEALLLNRGQTTIFGQRSGEIVVCPRFEPGSSRNPASSLCRKVQQQLVHPLHEPGRVLQRSTFGQ